MRWKAIFCCCRLRVPPIVCRSQVYVRHGTTSLIAALEIATGQDDRFFSRSATGSLSSSGPWCRSTTRFCAIPGSIYNPCRTSGSWLKMVDQALAIKAGVRTGVGIHNCIVSSEETSTRSKASLPTPWRSKRSCGRPQSETANRSSGRLGTEPTDQALDRELERTVGGRVPAPGVDRRQRDASRCPDDDV